MPQDTTTPSAGLPSTGYIRQADLIGTSAVTPEEAADNRQRNRSPVHPRDGRRGIVPFSSATLWRKVKTGAFPSPVKLSERVTAFRGRPRLGVVPSMRRTNFVRAM